MITFRSVGSIDPEHSIIHRSDRTRFRGVVPSENIFGVEKARVALQLIKELMRECQNPIMKQQLAKAGLSLNEYLIK